MPRGDRTGPLGQGQMSGRAMGNCAGYNDSSYLAGDFFGCGTGRGRALRGRGFGAAGRGVWPPVASAGGPPAPSVNEVDRLKAQIDGLERSLQVVKQRLLEVAVGAE